MRFGFTEDQIELQATAARFANDRFALGSIGEREGRSVDRRTWHEMAELGLFGLLLDEGDGGSGLGSVDAAIVFEQLGQHLVPGPVLWTVLAAGLVDGAATGRALVGGVGASDVTQGAAVLEHAGDLDVLLVLHPDRVVAHRPADLAPPEPLDPLDTLTPVGRVTGLDQPGIVVGDADTAARVRLVGTVLAAAMLVGIAARSLDVARAYALEREQFGTPIGSFQAIKHLLADMHVLTSLAQSETYAAASIVQDPGGGDPARAAARAKGLAGRAAIEVTTSAIQVHGAMGFTWEMLPNHLLKRAWVLEQGFGTSDAHALALGAAIIGAQGT